jgi:uncharacterized protein
VKTKKKNQKLAGVETALPATVQPAKQEPSPSIISRLFKKQENVFIQLIIQQASLTLEGISALQNYMENQSQAAANLLMAKEKEADETRRILINEINKTFITPFDREDIFALSRAIDDVLDYAFSTVTEMELFKVKPTSYMVQIAGLLREGANEIFLAVNRLHQYAGVASEHIRRAKAVENQVEEVYRLALANLFLEVEDVKQVVKAMKLREVYRHLSNAADRTDEAANVIADIVVKIM